MATAEQLQHILLTEWHDCYINDHKQRGYVATLDLSFLKYDYPFTSYWGANDKPQLIALTDGSRKPLTNVFLSLNAFDGKHRRASNLAQIRNIGIDIDCYKLGMTPEAAAKKLEALVFVGRVPNPNLLIRSGNGLQIVYGLAGGLPPTNEMKYLAMYITNELSTILQPLGADFAANTLERVFRLPNTYNEKPGKPKKLVTAEIWNRQECTLTELMEYCTPLEPKKHAHKPRKPKGELKYFDLTKTQGMTVRTLNAGRLNDFLRLVQLRNGAIEMRNLLTYDYAFTMALMTSSEAAVLTAAEQINDKFDDPQPPKTVRRTALNGFKDGRKFWAEYVKNGYKLVGLPKNLIKPKQTRTLIKQHAITLDEQRELGVTISKEIREDRRTEQRRAQGEVTRAEYLAQQKAHTDSRVEQLRELLKEQPGLSQRKAAEILGVSTKTIQRLSKKL